jgi:hypothetical protein
MMSYDEMAAECVRLRTINAELVAALDDLLPPLVYGWKVSDMQDRIAAACAALAKAE